MMLPVMEHFYTIQGEGHHAGRAAYFIRLGGCNVGCVWCDVKESWDAEKHPFFAVSEMVDWIKSTPATECVITGGEPCMYDLIELTAALKSNGIRTWLETSGAYPITGTWDWICVSPKKFKAPIREMIALADELKVVVFNESDFDWAIQHASVAKPNCKLFLQPEYSRFNKVMPLIIDFVKHNPLWRISLQMHKVIDVP